MSNTPAVFDTKALEKRIAESVQATFGMLIPPEAFNAMVEKEVKAYFELETRLLFEKSESRGEGWGRTAYIETYATMTPFRRQVWDHVQKHVKSELDKVFNADAYKAFLVKEWHNNHETVVSTTLSDLLGKKLEELAPKMMRGMFEQMFVGAVEQAKMEVLNAVHEKLTR